MRDVCGAVCMIAFKGGTWSVRGMRGVMKSRLGWDSVQNLLLPMACPWAGGSEGSGASCPLMEVWELASEPVAEEEAGTMNEEWLPW